MKVKVFCASQLQILDLTDLSLTGCSRLHSTCTTIHLVNNHFFTLVLDLSVDFQWSLIFLNIAMTTKM